MAILIKMARGCGALVLALVEAISALLICGAIADAVYAWAPRLGWFGGACFKIAAFVATIAVLGVAIRGRARGLSRVRATGG